MAFELPPAPDSADPVKAWQTAVVIPTYAPLAADKNPMFLERRVYQGSSGKVYPLAFTDRISEEKRDQTYDAVHLENEFLRVMILPQFGGRIHVLLDKTNGYDLIYRQNVIKPALVGLAGPWISGGIEFNWPQHHRPSTFMPAEVEIEAHADGARTVWLSEHDPMSRMKGMHGVCLHPGKAYLELKARLYNRTPLPQTFLWWANVATRVHEQYQSFFSPDVHYVADHAKRAMATFPLCTGRYYGVDYQKRARAGVSAQERPRQFVPPGTYAANDLSWYANIPVPTSYMAMGSSADFFGGYDHARRAGLVHFANHHVSPGKKQWTWGNHEFGYAWDRHLTDEDGPYIELMAGVFTDNQPDFSFLMPGETKKFSQYWYPIQAMGPAQAANLEAAMSLQMEKGTARVGVCVTRVIEGAVVTLEQKNKTKSKEIFRQAGDLRPGAPLIQTINLSGRGAVEELCVRVCDGNGQEIISYQPKPKGKTTVPPAATEPALPRAIATVEELYLTGLHLEQYRHATREPADYWREGLWRDPGDARCNNALGLCHLRRGEFPAAEKHFRQAIARLTARNPNPRDGEPYYNLGLCLRFQRRYEEAYPAFYKATWNAAWQGPAFHALAELDCRKSDWTAANEHLTRALRLNADNLRARNLKVIVLRELAAYEEADALLQETRALDPLDVWSRKLAGEGSRAFWFDPQLGLDVALDLGRAGLYREASDLLATVPAPEGNGVKPLVHYYQAYFAQQQDDAALAQQFRAQAAKASPDYCFPARLEEVGILRAAIEANPKDARAAYYLGNLLYDRRRHNEAITLWEKAARLDPKFSIVWRNLGIGYFNISGNAAKARLAYAKARAAAPDDARLLYEEDQLAKRMGVGPKKRLADLERHRALVDRRDDLSIELCALYNQVGQPAKALQIVTARRFQPWEGGEGMVLGQYVRTHLALGRQALSQSVPEHFAIARDHFARALECPENLGEARHLLANQSDVHFYLGLAAAGNDEPVLAKKHFTMAATFEGDFQQMAVQTYSEMTYYQALALRQLGRKRQATDLLRRMLSHAKQLAKAPAKIDYFATSLPAMLLFHEDLAERQKTTARFLEAQALLGLGRRAAALRCLRQVLQRDPNHALAGDLLMTENAAK